MVDFKTFRKLSKYKRKVDIKKLKFIFSSLNDYTSKLSNGSKELKILEVGCGDGSITLPLSSFGSVHAFDLDEGLVENLKAELIKKKIDDVFISKDNAYDFTRAEKFDVIVASEVLEHLDHPERVVRNIVNHLSPGGLFIATVPNGFGPWELSNKIKKFFSGNRIRESECGHKHVQFFSFDRFTKMIEEHGFRLVRFGKSDAFLIFSIMLQHTPIVYIDLLLADILPKQFASGWYFAFKKNT